MFGSKRDFIVLSLLSPFTHLQHLHLQCCLEIDQIGILPRLKRSKAKSFKLVIVWPKIDTLHTWKYMGKTVFGIQPDTEHIGHIWRFRVLNIRIPSAALMPRFALWSCSLWMLGRRNIWENHNEWQLNFQINIQVVLYYTWRYTWTKAIHSTCIFIKKHLKNISQFKWKGNIWEKTKNTCNIM